jgi:hypothetical protein
MKLEIKLEDISQAITKLISEKKLTMSQSKYFMDKLTNKKDYKTLAIYLYKKEYLSFLVKDMQIWLNQSILSKALKNSFITNCIHGNFIPLTMYIIKNDHVKYTYKGEKLDDPISLRKQIFNYEKKIN